jgi:H+/Na+-translocating ferredoxin:NAD+ oxidoreductase subunit G
MILRLALILMFIASIAAGGLSLLNNKTAPIIAEIKRVEQEKARQEVLSTLADSIRFEEVANADGFTYWKAFDENGSILGYAGLAFGKGYSSTIETVCGFDTNYDITGLKVTFQQETPGLGTKIQEIKSGEDDPWFLRAFKGVSALTVAVVQDRGTIDSVTGATVSSRALANSVRTTASQIQEAVLAAPAGIASMDDLEETDDSDDSIRQEYHDEESELEYYDDEEAE